MTIDFPITEGPQTMVAVGRDRRKRAGRDEGSAEADAESRRRAESDARARRRHRAADVLLRSRQRRGSGARRARTSSTDKTSAHVVYTIAEGPKIAVGNVIVRGNTYTETNVVAAHRRARERASRSATRRSSKRSSGSIASAFSSASTSSRRRPETGVAHAQRHHLDRRGEGPDHRRRARRYGADHRQHRRQSRLAARLRIDRASQSLRHRPLPRPGADLRAAESAGRLPHLSRAVHRQVRSADSGHRVPDRRLPPAHAHRAARRLHRGDARRALPDALVAALRVPHRQMRRRARHGDLCALAQNVLLPGLDRNATNVAISSLTPTFFWDKRDDSINPHRGFFTTASVEYAFPLDRRERALPQGVHADVVVPAGQRPQHVRGVGPRRTDPGPRRRHDDRSRDGRRSFRRAACRCPSASPPAATRPTAPIRSTSSAPPVRRSSRSMTAAVRR